MGDSPLHGSQRVSSLRARPELLLGLAIPLIVVAVAGPLDARNHSHLLRTYALTFVVGGSAVAVWLGRRVNVWVAALVLFLAVVGLLFSFAVTGHLGGR